MNIYKQIGGPGSFTSPGGIKPFSKKTLKKINEELKELESYSLLKQPRKPRVHNPVITYSYLEQIQIDLLDKSLSSKFNDGYRYILTAIDVFSRKAAVAPLKTKSATHTLEAFKNILKKFGGTPLVCGMDRGKEFINNKFLDYLKSKNIKYYHPSGTHKAQIVERWNRTLALRIAKYCLTYDTKRYIDVLDRLVEGYNESIHSTIHMSPNKATLLQNQHLVRQANEIYFSKALLKKRKPQYKVGDVVRIRLMPSKFRRGYQNQFTDELFYIAKVNTDMPIVTYNLRGLEDNDDIIGRFYSSELSAFKWRKEKL